MMEEDKKTQLTIGFLINDIGNVRTLKAACTVYLMLISDLSDI